jgi:ADP-heptose:LPS heptosyltransferase
LGTRIKKIRELGRHDIIFDLAAGNRSFLTCLLTPATLKIGFPYRIIRSWMFYDVTTGRSDLNFEVNDMLNMLHVLGARTEYPHRYDMPGSAIQRDRPYVVYFAGASTPEKCWPLDHFTKLIKQMAKDYPDRDHLVLDGLQDWERSDTILEGIENMDNIGSIRADTIEETTALMKGADLLISNDTGIRHVAIVCDTPTVGIFIGGAYRYWPRYPIHDAIFPTEKDSVVSVQEVSESSARLLT